MAVLKKKKEVTSNQSIQEDKVQELLAKISEIGVEIYNKYAEKNALEKELLELKIAPFKLGDYVMAEVSAGKTKKLQKCLLENDGGILYVRPVKADGELSNRHFSVIPVGNKTYSDILKPVEE